MLDAHDRLAERGHRIEAYVCKCDNLRPRNNFRFHCLRSVNLEQVLSTRTFYPIPIGLADAIARDPPEVVDAFSHLFLTTAQAVRVAKNRGIPSIVSVHGVYAARGALLNIGQGIYNRTVAVRTFREATLVRCLTEADAVEVGRLGCPRRKIRVIPNPVDTDLFKPRDPREDNLIVWTGRFVREKRLKDIVECMRIVASTDRRARLLLVGSGPLLPEIRSLVRRYGLDAFIRFTGPVERSRVAELLSKASIFLFSSAKEGMPVSVLEAMSAGEAVVSYDIPSMRQLVENNVDGLLVDDDSPDRLAQAVMNLLSDSKSRERIGDSARKSVLSNFGYSHIIPQLEKLYSEAAQSN